MNKTNRIVIALALASSGITGTAVLANHHAMANPMVGGAEMFPAKTIAENASAAPNLTTLVAAVSAAGLVETLASPGPFTVFAPTNDAFAKLPAGTVETLVKPENKATLTSILTSAGAALTTAQYRMSVAQTNVANVDVTARFELRE